MNNKKVKMMKFFATLATVLTLFAWSATAETKIAVIDMQVVMNGTEAAQTTQNELRLESEKANERFAKMDETFKARVEDLRRKKDILSEEKYMEEEAELRKLYREQQLEAQSVNEKLSREYKRVQKQISDEVDSVVTKLAKERGYDAVLRNDYLMYAAQSVDITEEVLNRVDSNLKDKLAKKGL